MRLEITLMNRGRMELALGHVAGPARLPAEFDRPEVLVQDGGAGLHGGSGVHHRGQHFVFHLDGARGFFGRVAAGGGHGRHGMTAVERLAAG